MLKRIVNKQNFRLMPNACFSAKPANNQEPLYQAPNEWKKPIKGIDFDPESEDY